MASEAAASPVLPEAVQRPDRSAALVKWFAVAGFALVMAYAIGVLTKPSEDYLRFQADFVYPLPSAVALALSLACWRRSGGVTRIGWLAIAVGLAAWMLGDLDYTYYDLRQGSEPPFPGPADLVYGIGYVAFALGVPLLTLPHLRLRDGRWLIDAGLIVTVAGAISWVYLVQPIASSGYSPRDAAIAMAYPVSDFALASLAIIGWYASGGRPGATRTLIIGALLAFAVADAGYTYLVTTAGYDNIGNPLDPVWMAGYLLLAIAALRVPEATADAERRQSLAGVVMPYAVAAAATGVALLSFRTGQGSVVLTVAAMMAIVLVVLRQIVTLAENVRLYHALETRTQEVTESHRALTLSEARLRTVVSNAPVVLFSIDNEGTFTLSEGAALASLGLAPGEVVGRRVQDIYADQPRILDSVKRALRGEEITDVVEVGGTSFATNYTPMRDQQGAITGLIGVATDVSERERFQQQLVHIASHDPLTGLFNRRRLDEELSRTVAEFSRHGVPAALLFIDLDQFKDVNDGHGHRSGDDLLAEVAGVLRAGVRETDVVARLGGDEFAVILTRADAAIAMDIAEHLLALIGEHSFEAQGARIRITASIGVAIVGADGTSSQELLARADIAMYRAKDEGRNRARAYDADADAEAQSRSGWQREIRDALAQDRLVLHAQPIVALSDRTTAMFEVLVRMVLPGGEIVPPASFLGVAERSGLITDIDCWVASRAIELIAESRARGEELHVAVNVSGRSLADRERLLSVIKSALLTYRVPGDHLVVEITETTAMHDLRGASEFARDVKNLGCSVALDDFGVGFSSFAQLKRLPVDYLKIDGSFIVNLARDRTDQQLVATMTAAAHALNKKVVAEFVTDEATLQLLDSFGVDYVQGYYLGAPAPLQSMRRAA